MSKPINSIEINGKRYDAQTGKPLGAPATQRRGSVDGVISHKATKKVVVAAPKPKVAQPIKPIANVKLMDMKAPVRRPHSVAKAVSGHSPQNSAALMRHAVQKPGKSLKRQHAATGHTDSLVTKPLQIITPKLAISSVPADRLKRAAKVAKSHQITRFTSVAASAPAAISVPKSTLIQPANHSSQASKPLDIFEQALLLATSHQQPAVKHVKHPRRQKFLSKRRVSVAATALSVLLLVGFLGFENRTSLNLHLAAKKAGFAAAMPGYKPSGFSVGQLNYSPGSVAIQFRSNSDQRAFAITEKPSSWDSATLRDNFVANTDNQYQTVNIGGRTVYLYGKNNAAWVNAGIWYQVQTNGSLSDQQLAQLAASL